MGVFVLAAAVYAVLIVAGYPFVGVGAWVAICAVGVAYRHRLDRPLFDERDEMLNRIAARRTIRILGICSAIGFPAAVVLWATGYNEWPPWMRWLAIYTAGIGFLYTGLRLYTRYER
ncbi:hypothetical protein A4G99_05335 [Haladaptatus sp. R4]|nr:hypothetical protein A4G99_05335 [Haladaptatus sp. R4]